jgi:hypothetical protein
MGFDIPSLQICFIIFGRIANIQNTQKAPSLLSSCTNEKSSATEQVQVPEYWALIIARHFKF